MSHRFAYLFWAGGLLLAGLFAAGCAKKEKKSPVAAVVGREEIRLGDITDILARQGRLFPSAEEEIAVKKKLLDSLVETRLLVQEAYRQKLDQDSLIKAFAEQERPMFLIDVLYFREVRDKVRLTDSEVRRFYKSLRNDRCFRQIIIPSRAVADSLLKLVKKGVRFDSLASLYSRDPLSASSGGDIGCFGWKEKAPPQLFERILEMKPGDVHGPFRAEKGWLLLQCYDERPAQLPDLKVFEPELRNFLEPYREDRRSPDFVAEVRKALGFRVVDSTARFVNVKQLELSKLTLPGQKEESYSVYIRTEELTPTQREMPLVTYKGGMVTAGQYLEIMQGSMPGTRMVLDTGETATAMLFQLVFRDAMVQTALARGLDKDPEFLKLFKQTIEGRMAELMKYHIYSAVPFDTSRVLAYYRTHPEEFLQPPAVHLFELNRPREQEILSLKREIRNKAQLMSSAFQLTARTQLRASGGDLGWVEQHQYPELFAAAQRMKTGEIAGPIRLADSSYSLICLEARRPARRQTFTEVQGELFERLLIQAQDSALAAWFSEAKKRTKVFLYAEVLQNSIDQTYYARLKEWQDKRKEGTS